MGQKAAEMLRLIPDPDLQVIERCSGHGGAWGVMKGNFDIALKVGQAGGAPGAAIRQGAMSPRNARWPASISCRAWRGSPTARRIRTNSQHPIQLFAKAYGLM